MVAKSGTRRHQHTSMHNYIVDENKTIQVKLKSILIKSHKYGGKRCKHKNYILSAHTHTCEINYNPTTHTHARSYLSVRAT